MEQTQERSPSRQASVQTILMPPSVRFDGIYIHFLGHRVFCGGREVILTPKEYSLLMVFIQNPNRVFSREDLLTAVWGYSSFGHTRTVDVHIQRLRKKLGLKKRIRTVAKVGYCFCDDVLIQERIKT